ncbi:MAG: pseudouridine synthase, partial [Bacteroidota bacterium]
MNTRGDSRKGKISGKPYKKHSGKHRSGATIPDSKRTTVRRTEKEVTYIRLNKYIANSGVCSRRNADIYIASGNVTVNGKAVTEMGYKVKQTDTVCFDGKQITPEKKEYVLLNKPKGFITTTKDERGRKTVMELVSGASKSRLLPVGRLDRNTTGLLLFTNDGDMARKLTHPKHGIRKLYHVVLQ